MLAAAHLVADRGRVLIIEDDAAIRELLDSTLAGHGFECSVAPDVEQARPILAQRPPQLILLDWMLPGMSGVEFAGHVRRDPRTSAIPILMVSARGAEADRLRGLRSADDYLTKPFSCRELVARVRILLRRFAETHREPWQAERLPGATSPVCPAPTADQSAAPPPLKVLLVEDDPLRRHAALGHLERLGCRTASAENGLLAVRYCLDWRADMVLVKPDLPVMSGIEAARWIRAALESPLHPWIVACTADARRWSAGDLNGAGFNDVLWGTLNCGSLRVVLQRARQSLPPRAAIPVSRPS
jgi:DNA-binding response OmpR family regulator